VADHHGSTAPSPLRVTVQPPAVSGDTVMFAWEQSTANPHQPRDRWSMRYDGLDLAGFAPELLLEVFLALQLKVWAAHPGEVEIRLPFAVPAWTVAFWRDYHRASNLRVEPLAENRAQDPWPGGASGLHPHYEHIVFFGGGKDSGAAAGLLNEIGGPGSTLLLSHTASTDPRPAMQEAARRRIVEFIQQPVAAATGMPTATFWTDYLANWRRNSDPPLPFLEVFHAGTLPLLVAHGARLTSVGHPRDDFYVLAPADTSPIPHRWSGRPETLAAISAHYRRAWDIDVQPTSIVYPISYNAEYHLLAARYPALYQSLVSCGSPNAVWCYACRKCLRHALATLSTGMADPRFDYSMMFRSHFLARLMTAIRQHDVRQERYLVHPNMANGASSLSERMSELASTPPEALRTILAPDARAVWQALRDHYDGPFIPESMMIPLAGIAGLPTAYHAPITNILGQHFAIVDDIPDTPFADGSVVIYAWHIPLVLTGEVERLVPAGLRRASTPTASPDPGDALPQTMKTPTPMAAGDQSTHTGSRGRQRSVGDRSCT